MKPACIFAIVAIVTFAPFASAQTGLSSNDLYKLRSVGEVDLSPDGARVLTGSGDGTARLWGAATGAAVVTLEGHKSSVSAVALTPSVAPLGANDENTRLFFLDSLRCGRA